MGMRREAEAESRKTIRIKMRLRVEKLSGKSDVKKGTVILIRRQESAREE